MHPFWQRVWRNGSIFSLIVCLLLSRSSMHAQSSAIRRVAVLDFQNLTGDKDLERFGLGIPDAISDELLRVRSLDVIERQRIDDALREVRLQQTKMIDPATAKRAGKLIGADSLIVGTFQKWGERIQLTARVVDVESGRDRAPVRVDGALKDLFKLQATLARQILVAVEGAITQTDRDALDQIEARRLDAFEAYSDGLYFLRKEQAASALAKFDLTLSIDPKYPGAQYYRGVALEKLNRLDEAATALLSALPKAETDWQPEWSWQPPKNAKLIRGVDLLQAHIARDLFTVTGTATYETGIIYAEPAGQALSLHFFDPETHEFKQTGLPEASAVALAPAKGHLTLLLSPDVPDPRVNPPEIRIYGFQTPDASLLWRKAFTNYGSERPRIGIISDDRFYVYWGGSSLLEMRDGHTGDVIWSREGLVLDRLDPPILRHTKTHGDILIAQAGNVYHAIRVSDKQDAWTVTAQSEQTSDLANDQVLVTFQPERGATVTDLETGRTIAELAIVPFADNLNTAAGPKSIVAAVLEGDRLYLLSRQLLLHVIEVNGGNVLGAVQLEKRPQSIRAYGSYLYLGTDTGELQVLDVVRQKIVNTAKLSREAVVLWHVGADGIVANSNAMLFGVTLIGDKTWDAPMKHIKPDVNYFGGVLILRSPVGMSTIDVKTGEELWHVSATPVPAIFTPGTGFFVAGMTSMDEYPTAKLPEGIVEKQILSELASVYLAMGDLTKAAPVVQQAGAIDRNYPPYVLDHARLLLAREEVAEGRRELARYAAIVGFESAAGQSVIAQLKREHGLVWHADIGMDTPGEPLLMGNRLVTGGRRVGNSHVVAIDLQTGKVAWRQPADRFVASTVCGDGSHAAVWSVSGSVSDPNVLVLRHTDLRTETPVEVSRWRNSIPVREVAIACSSDRIFVAAASPDPASGVLGIALSSLDVATGKPLWHQQEQRTVPLIGLIQPLSAFSVDGDRLVYEVGGERHALRVSDGMGVSASQPGHAAPQVANVPAEPPLWDPSAAIKAAGRFYAFTPDGHAYAIASQ